VLAPAGVRLLAVDGPRRGPLGATVGEDRPTSAEGSTAAAGQPRRCRAGSRPPRVLLVDDSRAMRRVLRGLLEDAGIPVVGEAGDGAQGVELAEEQLCAAVLAAWQPPAGPS
jgi:PleD family two-component response regulator